MIHGLVPPSARENSRAKPGLLAFSLTLLLASIPPGARAADIRWLCWDDPKDNAVHCVLDTSMMTPAELGMRHEDGHEDAEGRRLSGVLPGHMPSVVRQLRLSPRKFAGSEVRIPLLGPPENMQHVQELAQSFMCGSRDTCTVTISANRPSAQLLNMIGNDPALQ